MMRKVFWTMALAAVSAQGIGPADVDAQSHRTAEDEGTGVRVFHHENVLGTSLALKVKTPDGATALRAESAVLAEIDRCNGILSAWDSNSEFSRWMATKGTAEKVSPELIEVLSLFDAWRMHTGGALDASAETATRLWKTAALEQRRPAAEEKVAAVNAMKAAHWRVDRDAGTAVHLDDAPIALNSFAKSYISGRAADAALAAGATGVLLNLGGDLVVRGALTERVAIANPAADAENDMPLDMLHIQNRAVATSGGYRRGVEIDGEHISHLFDPRTAEPALHVASATVVAPDAVEAGALATAFAVMQPDETAALASRMRHVDYMLVMADGSRVTSAGWSGQQAPHIVRAAYAPRAAAPAAFDLMITLELARIEDPRYRRPYVSVWVEDKDHFPVKTIALWFQKPRWLSELKSWYHDDQIRTMAEGTDLSTSISAATRPPGKYTLRWDGKDNAGKAVKPGHYTICVEAAREHGTYQIIRQEIDFDGRTAKQMTLPGGTEIGGVTLDYGAHAK
jgi:thiamine biosynthesis lipoprotein